MTKCNVRYIHKISPSDKDVVTGVQFQDSAFQDCKTLGRGLRDAGILNSGDRIRNFRTETTKEGTRIVCFPTGACMIWHSIILTVIPKLETMGWTTIMSLVAQGVINISEGITTIEPGSPVHKAMEALCTRFTAIENGKEGLPPQFKAAAAHLAGYSEE